MEDKLKEAAVSVLRKIKDLETYTVKQLRKELETSLKLKKDELKTPEYKAILTDIVLEYTKTLENKGTGKYSSEEKELILKYTEDYLQVHGLTEKDICPELREEDNEGHAKRKVCTLWKELQERIPHRPARYIYDFVVRNLMAKYKRINNWSDEEKSELINLVDIHGRKWNIIGKLMNRSGDDCRHVYYRCGSTRKVSGPFTEEEDQRILAAVRSATGQENISKLGSAIPWEAVAVLLKNERLGVDYCRRWPRVIAHVNGKRYGNNAGSSSNSSNKRQRVAGVEDAVSQDAAFDNNSDDESNLVRVLIDLDVEEEQEVSWREVDTACKVNIGVSVNMWKSLCKKYCSANDSFLSCIKILKNRFEL